MLAEPVPCGPVILACSPNSGGMSDQAATAILKELKKAGEKPKLLRVRDHDIMPCTGCQRCRHDPNRACFLGDLDDSAPLFQAMLEAPKLYICSPIYFYHLPATFKAFIDRAQRFYYSREDGDPLVLGLPKRKAFACLVAGRSKGERLFDGSLLTLKYFLDLFNFSLCQSVLFKGMDEIASLSERPEHLAALSALTRA